MFINQSFEVPGAASNVDVFGAICMGLFGSAVERLVYTTT